jgi:hypothetical protein
MHSPGELHGARAQLRRNDRPAENDERTLLNRHFRFAARTRRSYFLPRAFEREFLATEATERVLRLRGSASRDLPTTPVVVMPADPCRRTTKSLRGSKAKTFREGRERCNGTSGKG